MGRAATALPPTRRVFGFPAWAVRRSACPFLSPEENRVKLLNSGLLAKVPEEKAPALAVRHRCRTGGHLRPARGTFRDRSGTGAEERKKVPGVWAPVAESAAPALGWWAGVLAVGRRCRCSEQVGNILPRWNLLSGFVCGQFGKRLGSYEH